MVWDFLEEWVGGGVLLFGVLKNLDMLIQIANLISRGSRSRFRPSIPLGKIISH
jgi:hypothetical protein